VVGASVVFTDPEAAGLRACLYPTDRAAYGRLSRLLTLGKRRASKGGCELSLHDLFEHAEGLLCVASVSRSVGDPLLEMLAGMRERFDDDRLWIGASHRFDGEDGCRLRMIDDLCGHLRVGMVATNDALFHEPERRALQDVLTCIRHGCTLDEAGRRIGANAERHLKAPEEMARLFARYPCAIARTVEIADRCAGFSLDQLKYEYPEEVVPRGQTAISHLAALAWGGARERYPRGVPDRVRGQIEHELRLIEELRFAPYFLTVHDIVVFARSRGILCQGRGAAANSAVCYVLGVTSVDPDRINVLFERFISRERNEPPDIDIDFEHERREEVIQYLYAKYGRDRAALTAEVITYRGRSAVREVGKALGLSLDAVDRLAKDMDWWSEEGIDPESLRHHGLDPRDRTAWLLAGLTGQIMGFPRHRSQHVGGFVISRGPLSEIVPIENAAMDDRTVVEWDKDDLDAMGMLKVDVLGLGMLTCIRKGFELVEKHHERSLTLANVPAEDPAVYDMLCAADSVGVFQVESRAQMSMLPRLKPRCFYDLVIEVAIVRPGPIQGKMVHPYLRRRAGEEPVTYPSDDVRTVLGRTLGVPLFQEQAMSLAIVAAGFTPGEADQLRRAMAAWKRKGDLIQRFGAKIIAGMSDRGYPLEFAERCFEQIKGFSSYGFPESHAASFALLVYVSSWLKRHHPAAFGAALLNSQPMGFYAPAQIIRDAREHGVEVRAVDVNHSEWDCTLEPAAHGEGGVAIRLGMRLVGGMREADASAIERAVAEHGRLCGVEELWKKSGVPAAALRRLASADAMRSMGLERQRALWEVRALREEGLPLFEGVSAPPSEAPRLPAFSEAGEVTRDYASVGLSLRRHPIAFARESLMSRGVVRAVDLADPARMPAGSGISVAGIVLMRQRPSTASGIVFITLEDETGVANLIVRPRVYERFRRVARHSSMLVAHGTVERQGIVVHVVVGRLSRLNDPLAPMRTRSRDFH
jgi:error-prone DNA polymerase